MQGTIKGKQSKVPLFDDIAFSQRDFGAEVSCARGGLYSRIHGAPRKRGVRVTRHLQEYLGTLSWPSTRTWSASSSSSQACPGRTCTVGTLATRSP